MIQISNRILNIPKVTLQELIFAFTIIHIKIKKQYNFVLYTKENR